MSDTRITGYAEAVLAIAYAEGQLAEVEDELFRFARTLEGSDELRSALTDPHVPAARRQQIVEDLLGGKASSLTVALVSMIVGAGRAADLPKVVDEVVSRSAMGRGEAVAEVRSAVALSADQQNRLAAALADATGKQITIRNVVDPSVLGGVVTTIDDDVLDGSVRTRLNQLRDAF
ncbi:MAG TPA: ATP synthase F1 subunit delta [Microthrixaceae bacterium]|nr:ATP synthase F1 subunit delta [Microthrixaceae bacterium]